MEEIPLMSINTKRERPVKFARSQWTVVAAVVILTLFIIIMMPGFLMINAAIVRHYPLCECVGIIFATEMTLCVFTISFLIMFIVVKCLPSDEL